MNTAGMLKTTTISMDMKPIAMAPLISCSTMKPSMDKSNPRSGVTVTASPMIWITNTMVAISTLPCVITGPHSPGHTGICIGPMGTMARVQTFTETIQAMVVIICKTVMTCMINSTQSMTTNRNMSLKGWTLQSSLFTLWMEKT